MDSKKQGVRMLRLRVKEVAQEKGLSVVRLSQRTEISYNTVKSIFRNPYRSVNTEILQRIADVLSVPVTELMEDVPPEQREREMNGKA